MTELSLVDSNIWHAAYTRAREPESQPVHDRAAQFAREILSDASITIAMSSYGLAEIMELLRKSGLGRPQLDRLHTGFTTSKFRLIETTLDHVQEGLRLSRGSGIHVYDYLVCLHCRSVVNVMYSADDHLRHSDFLGIAPVENPLAPWVLREGKKPVKS